MNPSPLSSLCVLPAFQRYVELRNYFKIQRVARGYDRSAYTLTVRASLSASWLNLSLRVMFHVKVQTTRISIRDNFIQIPLGSARSLSEEVLVRIKVREMFDHFASPTLESIQSYLKTTGKAFVSHSMLIRGYSQCVWSTLNALQPPQTVFINIHPRVWKSIVSW